MSDDDVPDSDLPDGELPDDAVPYDDVLDDAALAAQLRAALTPAPAPIDPVRIAELRAAVEQQRRATGAATMPGHARRRLLAAAAAVALLGVGAAVGALVTNAAHDAQPDLLARGSDEFTATLVGDGIEVEVDGDRAPEGRILTLRSPSLPVLPVGEYYELWFVDPSGDRISAGTFHPDEAGHTLVVLHAAVDPRLTGLLEITEEPADGDPAPSGVVVASGRAEVG